MTIDFKDAPLPPEVILMGSRWYVAYPLSTRHVEALMEEREVEVDHFTMNRWVIKDSPPLEEAFHRRKRAVWVSWRKVFHSCGSRGGWLSFFQDDCRRAKTIALRVRHRRHGHPQRGLRHLPRPATEAPAGPRRGQAGVGALPNEGRLELR